MLFSIVIPAYNYATYLPKSVESAVTQNGDDFEVIIVDDGSTDDTPAVAADLLKKFESKLRYVRQENRGLAATRNRGIKESHGQYLLFLDADDRLLDGALDRFRIALASLGDCGMICGGHISIHPNGEIKTHLAKGPIGDSFRDFSGYLRKEFGIANGASIMSRDVFNVVKYPEHIRNSEDIPVFLQVLSLYKCHSFPDPVLEVLKHDDSLRNNLKLILDSSSQLEKILFDEKILPPKFMLFEQEFKARNSLSVFRSLYLAGRHAEARHWYHRALRLAPRLLTEWSYLSKYVRSYVKG